MSRMEREPDESPTVCGSKTSDAQTVEVYDARVGKIGDDMEIRRALPLKERRLIGPWCFLDHFGPVRIKADDGGMKVRSHPHIGLQTVTWLLDGTIHHKDSLGSAQDIRPGQLNIMTAGEGITHAELTRPGTLKAGDAMHGTQLWVALPKEHSRTKPAFEHHASLPILDEGGMCVTILAGEHDRERSPATVFSPMVGLDVALASGGQRRLPLSRSAEHGVMVLEGEVEINGVKLVPGKLGYFGVGCDHLRVASQAAARFIVIGGEPLGEEVMIWWNFVARSKDEIVAAKQDWESQSARFGKVPDLDPDDWLHSPEVLPAG
jgi:quercetin 2,3-dioxygenase